MLKEQPKNTGAMGIGTSEVPLHDERTPTLADPGISEMQSHRWQKISSVQGEETI